MRELFEFLQPLGVVDPEPFLEYKVPFDKVEALFRNLPNEDKVTLDYLVILQYLDVVDQVPFQLFRVPFEKVEVLFRNLPFDDRVAQGYLLLVQHLDDGDP